MLRILIPPTDAEDAAITKAALEDPNARPFTDEEWKMAKPTMRVGTKPIGNKQTLTVRYDVDIIERFRATGKGWQTRMNDALKDWLKDHLPTQETPPQR